MTRELIQALVRERLERSNYVLVNSRMSSPAPELDQFFYDGKTIFAVMTLDPADQYPRGNDALTKYAQELGENGIHVVPVFDRSRLTTSPIRNSLLNPPNLVQHVLSWAQQSENIPLTLVRLSDVGYMDTFKFQREGNRFRVNILDFMEIQYYHGCQIIGKTRSGIHLAKFYNNVSEEPIIKDAQKRVDELLDFTSFQSLYDDGLLDDFTEEVKKEE